MSGHENLKLFYAVTTWTRTKTVSVYEAKIGGEGQNPALTKIALKGESKATVGRVATGGSMLGIHECLTLFIPEGGGLTSYQRDIILVNTRYWGFGSSPIVAIFLDIGDAMMCFNESDLQPKDKRWMDKTIETLRAIGLEHPYCSISAIDAKYWLVAPSDWQIR